MDIWLFFRDNSDIHYTVDWLEGAWPLHRSEIEEAAKELIEETSRFLKIYDKHKTEINKLDLKSDFEKHIASLEEKRDRDKAASSSAWKEFKTIDHRLDFMGWDDPRRNELDKECDRLNEKQKKASAIASQSISECYKAYATFYGYENFNIRWIYVLVCQLEALAESIISENEDLQ